MASTETWLSNEDSKNQHVIDQCVAHGYTLPHSPRTSGRRGGGVDILVNNAIKVTFRRIHVSPQITSFELMEAVLTIRKLLQTNIPDTIIKFITNYIKGRKAYTTYRNHTSKQRQFKTGVPQGGVLSPILFNIYTSDLPPPSAPVQVMAYADDITITSTHTSTSAAKKYIQP